MAKSLLNQFTQTRGSRTYSDDLTMALAELAGRSLHTGLLVTITGTATVTQTNGSVFEANDLGNYIVVGGAAHEITVYNSPTVVTVAGSPGDGAGQSAAVHSRKNLEDDLNYIRTQLDLIVGEVNWNDVPADTLSGIDNRLDNLVSTFIGLTDTYVSSFTPNNMLYTSSSGVHDTADMTYDPDTGDIRMGADGGAKVIINTSEATTVYGDDDTYITVSGGSAGFTEGGTLKMSLTDAGLALQDGARVTDIQNTDDADTIDSSSTDTQLATAKLIWETISGTLDTQDTFVDHSDTPAAYAGNSNYLLRVNSTPDAVIFESELMYDSSTFTIGGDLVAVNADFTGNMTVTGTLDVDGAATLNSTLGLATGTTVNDIQISMGGTGDDSTLLTEKAIYDYVNTVSGAIDDSMIWEIVDTPTDQIRPKIAYLDYTIYTEGNVTIGGDLTVTGTLFYTDTETVQVSDNILHINYGEVGAGVTAGEAGMQIDRGSEEDYFFLFDEGTSTFRVGVSGVQDSFNDTTLQPVATREDAPIDTRVPWWEDSSNTFRTQGDTYITVNSGTNTIVGAANDTTVLSMTDAAQTIGVAADTNMAISQSADTITFEAANTTEMTIGTGGVTLKNSTADVNEILNVNEADSISAASTDDQLATAKLIYDYVDTISGSMVHNELEGLQGGTAGQYYHITSNENAAFSSNGSTFTFTQDLAGVDLDLSGTFSFDSGNTVNEILDSTGDINAGSTDDQLATAKLIYNEISTLSGTVGSQTFEGLTDTPVGYSDGWFLVSTTSGVAWYQYLDHNTDINGFDGGGGGEYNHLSANEYDGFSSDGSTWTFLQDVTFTAGGATVGTIDTTISEPGLDTSLVTEQAVVEWVDTVSGTLQDQITGQNEFIELTDTPAAYAGNVNSLLRANGTPDAVVFEGDLTYDGSTLVVDGNVNVSGTLDFDGGQAVNEIVSTVTVGSTDSQLPTAGAVWDLIDLYDPHVHYEIDLTISGSSNTWTVTSGIVADLSTDNMDVYLNGLLNRDHTDYFTALVEGSKLTVTFAYNTYESDWTHVKFLKITA